MDLFGDALHWEKSMRLQQIEIVFLFRNNFLFCDNFKAYDFIGF